MWVLSRLDRMASRSLCTLRSRRHRRSHATLGTGWVATPCRAGPSPAEALHEVSATPSRPPRPASSGAPEINPGATLPSATDAGRARSRCARSTRSPFATSLRQRVVLERLSDLAEVVPGGADATRGVTGLDLVRHHGVDGVHDAVDRRLPEVLRAVPEAAVVAAAGDGRELVAVD